MSSRDPEANSETRGVSHPQDASEPSHSAPSSKFDVTLYPETIPPDTVVLDQDDTPDRVLFLHSGIVKLVHLQPDGRESLLGLRSQGWWINPWIVLAGSPSPWSVRAVTECSISSFPASSFADRLGSDPRLMMEIVLSQSRELSTISNRMVTLSNRTLELSLVTRPPPPAPSR